MVIEKQFEMDVTGFLGFLVSFIYLFFLISNVFVFFYSQMYLLNNNPVFHEVSKYIHIHVFANLKKKNGCIFFFLSVGLILSPSPLVVVDVYELFIC